MNESTITEDTVFKISGLTKVYQMGEVKVHALRGVDMEIYSRELIVMLGHQAAGNPLSLISSEVLIQLHLDK